MKLVTWNVRYLNKKSREGIKFIFNLSPDIVSLQEVTYSDLKFLLRNYREYFINYSFDLTGKTLERSCFVVIMTKTRNKLGEVGSLTYSKKPTKSLMYSVLYKKISGHTEQHISPYIGYKDGPVNSYIFAARFSTAVSPKERIKYLKQFPDSDRFSKNIIIGDLNVSTGLAMGYLSGVFRSYSLKEMFTNERVYFDNLVMEKGYTNPFSGRKTTQVPMFNHQFDHILLPNSARIINLKMYGGKGSDHKILFSEIELN